MAIHAPVFTDDGSMYLYSLENDHIKDNTVSTALRSLENFIKKQQNMLDHVTHETTVGLSP